MNIEINLLPEELRPRPPVETRSLVLILVAVALVAGCVFLYMAKAGADSDRADMEARIASINQEIQTLSTNKEAVALTNSIAALKAVKANYETFLAARIDWGDAVGAANALVPQGIYPTKFTQSGTTLVIEGSTSGYNAVASYARALDIDRRFTLTGVPSLVRKTSEGGGVTNVFGIIVEVAPGGGA
jgi:Tfp pilus assembly protein PilN